MKHVKRTTKRAEILRVAIITVLLLAMLCACGKKEKPTEDTLSEELKQSVHGLTVFEVDEKSIDKESHIGKAVVEMPDIVGVLLESREMEKETALEFIQTTDYSKLEKVKLSVEAEMVFNNNEWQPKDANEVYDKAFECQLDAVVQQIIYDIAKTAPQEE